MHHANGECAMQTGSCSLHRFKQIAAVETVHQMGNDFRVGLARKDIALALQFATQAS